MAFQIAMCSDSGFGVNHAYVYVKIFARVQNYLARNQIVC